MGDFFNLPAAMLEALSQAAEDMGTMDYTPYLLMRGWRFRSHAGQPGLDYMQDPLGGAVLLNAIAVSRQLLRDEIEQDTTGFIMNARRCAPLPEPLLTEVRAYRERQRAAGLQNHQVPPEPEPIVTDLPGDYFTPPEPADPLSAIVEDVLGTPQTATRLPRPPILVGEGVLMPRRPRKKKEKPPEEPKPVPTDRSPLSRNFNFGDRE